MDSSTSNRCDQAVVTLASVNPQAFFPFPERRIYLTKENPVVRIGRTSKRNSSFQATGSNCWFDSAVMSREHAELRFDFETQTVLMTDTGSLHGSFYNEEQMQPNKPQAMENGGIIRFGIPIERGRDTYFPCTMESTILLKVSRPEDRPTVFRVPDDTDIEDVSGDEDSGVHMSSSALLENNIRPARSSPPPGTIPIDLTGNDQETHSISSFRDDTLSTPNPASSAAPSKSKSSYVDLTAPSELSFHEHLDHDALSPAMSELVTRAEEQVEDADEEFQIEQDSPRGSEELDINLSDSLGSDDDLASEASSLASNSSPSDASPLIPDDLENEDDSRLFIEDEFGDDDRYDVDEGTSCPVAHSQIDAEQEMDVAGHSCSINHTLVEQAVLSEPSGGYESSGVDQIDVQLAGVEGTGVVNQELTPASQNTGSQSVVISPDKFLYNSHLPPMATLDDGVQLERVRLPSLYETMHQRPFAPSASNGHSVAEAMGAKTGKYEYFYAREDNRVSAQESTRISQTPITPVCRRPLVFPTDSMKAMPYHQDVQPLVASGILEQPESMNQTLTPERYQGYQGSLPRVLGDHADALGPWCTSGEKFLHSHPPSEDICLPQYRGSPPLDETSAYQFEMSKKLAGVDGLRNNRMGINNLVESPNALAQDSEASNSQKRKADDISGLSSAEEIAELSKIEELPQEQAQEEDVAPRVNRSLQPTASGSQEVAAQPSTTVVFGDDLMRPAKRLRRVAEVVGIAALGGAMVMSALIATAPTF